MKVPGLVAVILLICAAIYCFGGSPLEDDYGRLYAGNNRTLGENVAGEYNGWSGRWLGTGLAYALGKIIQSNGSYQWALLILGLLFLLSLLLSVFTFVQGNWSERLIIGLILAAHFWSNAPSPGQTFYWLTGSLENITGWTLSLLGLSLLKRIGTGCLSAMKGVLAAALLFGAPGCHELVGIGLVITLVGWATLALIAGQGSQCCLLLIMGAVAAIGTLVVVCAPGNAVRIAATGDHGNLTRALIYMNVQLCMWLPAWLSHLSFLGIAVLLSCGGQKPALSRIDRKALIGTTCLVLVISALFAAPSWALGARMPPRTLNSVYLVFTLGCLLLVLGPLAGVLRRHCECVKGWIAIALTIGLLGGHNARHIWVDLPVRIWQHRNELMQREWLINRARSIQDNDTLELPSMTSRPHLYWDVDLRHGSKVWPNPSAGRYFGVNAITIEETKTIKEYEEGK